MRAYYGTTLEGLRALVESGTVADAVLHGVTPALREAVAGSDDEELEFLATAAAADDALEALAAHAAGSPGPWRRVVVALDLDGLVAGEGTVVLSRAGVPWAAAACVLVDDARADVDAALRRAAASGDPAAADDHDLQWYACQEVDRLLAGE